MVMEAGTVRMDCKATRQYHQSKSGREQEGSVPRAPRMNADLPMCCLTGDFQSHVRSTVYCWGSTATGKHLRCGFSIARNGHELAQELFLVRHPWFLHSWGPDPRPELVGNTALLS